MTTFLLAGARRTGTTLLNAVLCSDPATNPLVGEAQLLTRTVETYVWGKEHFDLFVEDYFGDPGSFRSFYAARVADFFDQARRRFRPASHLVLKNPELSLVLGDLAELDSEARFLISVRDPRDQVTSELDTGLRQLDRGWENPVAAERDIEALAHMINRYYAPILDTRDRYPERIHFVRYEDLVLRTTETLDRLSAFTGLDLGSFDRDADWARVGLDWERYRGLPSFTSAYGKKIDASRVGRHVRHLSEAEIDTVDRTCRELMISFGYPTGGA